MNPRPKTQFKTWQRLPELAGGGARTVSGRGACAAARAAETRDGLRSDPAARKETGRPPLKDEGKQSRILKFIFTTHD